MVNNECEFCNVEFTGEMFQIENEFFDKDALCFCDTDLKILKLKKEIQESKEELYELKKELEKWKLK